jgi:hypothetical protein
MQLSDARALLSSLLLCVQESSSTLSLFSGKCVAFVDLPYTSSSAIVRLDPQPVFDS